MAHLWLNYLLRIKTNIHIEPLVYPRVSTILNHDHVCWFPKFLSPSLAVNVGVVPCADRAAPLNSFKLASGERERDIIHS